MPADSRKSAHKAMIPTIEKMSGKDFEAQCLAQIHADHQKTANPMMPMMAHEKMTQDVALKAFIGKTLPVVQQHLSMAQKDNGIKM